MSWPQDYQSALQNPLSNFKDPDLLDGTLESTITGRFASVSRVQSNTGVWAVRCFLHDFPDHKERYEAIGNHLASAKLPYTVGFQFLEKGIRVRRKWFPILKMEWIEAPSLKDYIEENISDSPAIAALADRWIVMLRALRKNKIAHGDLEHGNIRISGGDFRLIDYDGMFVPALAGRASHEVGHPNYQHPGRSETDFGLHLDNFSGWMIYLTLVALSVEPGLWAQFGRGEDHLLFKKDDLEQPRLSRVFRSIEQLKDDRIQKYVPLFRSFLGMELSAIASPADVIGVKPKKRETQRPVKPAWSQEVQLDLFAPQSAPVLMRASVEQIQPVLPPHIAPDIFHFSRSCRRERVMIAFYGAFTFTILTLAARGTISLVGALLVLLAGLGCTVVSLTCSYMSLSEVRGKLLVWLKLEWRRGLGETVRRGLVGLSHFITGLEAKEASDMQRLAVHAGECTQREKKRIAEVKSTVAAFIEELNDTRATLSKAELEETSLVLNKLQVQHNALLQEGAFLVNAPTEKLERPGLKRLRLWRVRVEELARKGPPIILPEAEQAAIRKKYQLERQSVQQSEAAAMKVAQRKIERIRAGATRVQERIDWRRERQHVWFERVKQVLRRQIEIGTSWLDENQGEMKSYVADMDRYREIRLSRYLPRLFGFFPKM